MSDMGPQRGCKPLIENYCCRVCQWLFTHPWRKIVSTTTGWETTSHKYPACSSFCVGRVLWVSMSAHVPLWGKCECQKTTSGVILDHSHSLISC